MQQRRCSVVAMHGNTYIDSDSDSEPPGPRALTRQQVRDCVQTVSIYGVPQLMVKAHNMRLTTVDADAFADHPTVTCIQLTYNLLSDLSNVQWPPALQSLILSDNRFAEIPSNLPSSLTSLQIDNNAITIIRRDTIRGLPKLEVFHVALNRIRRIEDGAFTKTDVLRYLNLAGNLLKDLGENTMSPHLTHLFLAGNRISVCPPTWLEHTRDLFTVDLGGNPITNIAPDFIRCGVGVRRNCHMALTIPWEVRGLVQDATIGYQHITQLCQHHTNICRTIPLQAIEYMNKTIPNWCNDVGKHVLLPFLTF